MSPSAELVSIESRQVSQAGRRWAMLAIGLGVAHAAVSVVWLLGSTWLLDTVGGALEEWGRSGSWATTAGLVVVIAAKLSVVVAAFWLGGWWRPPLVAAVVRRARAVFWCVAVGMAAYGTLLAVVGAVVLSGLEDVDVANRRALRWHTVLWDPWFAVWGGALSAAWWLTRHVPIARRPVGLLERLGRRRQQP